MKNNNNAFWRKASAVFDERAREYDQWFESSLLFRIELQALEQLRTPLAAPKFEVGIGPGRFAEQLGVRFGIDPARAPLLLAGKRGCAVCQAIGGMLPVRDRTLGTVFLLFTLCFMDCPETVLAECYRVLRPGGHLVLGMVPAQSSWGKMLTAKKEQGHPFYRYARFHEPEQVRQQLVESGFTLTEARSSLQQPPEQLENEESSEDGIIPSAGFVVFVGRR